MPKAIESVLAQTYTGWELIVVDDGSTDNSADVVKGFEDERIRYVYQNNAERCVARNNGVAHARGEYICFLDSDDYYLPERLSKLLHELEERRWPVGMFYTGMMLEKAGKISRSEVNYQDDENVFDNIVDHIIHSQQMCISRSILNEFKYDPQFHIGEDMELWLRIARNYPLIYLEEQYTIVVLVHDDRSVNVMRYNSGVEQLRLYRYVFAESHSGNNISKKNQLFMMAGAYHAISRYNVHQGKRWAALQAIFLAWNTDKYSEWAKFRINIMLKLVTFSSMEKIKGLIDYH